MFILNLIHYSCCQTSRGLQHNILSLNDARVLNISDASPKLCLIYDDCQSSLAQFIANNPLARGNGRRRKQETEFFKLGIQLVQAIHYLHSRGICHGNLNPGNILVNASFSNALCYVLCKHILEFRSIHVIVI